MQSFTGSRPNKSLVSAVQHAMIFIKERVAFQPSFRESWGHTLLLFEGYSASSDTPSPISLPASYISCAERQEKQEYEVRLKWDMCSPPVHMRIIDCVGDVGCLCGTVQRLPVWNKGGKHHYSLCHRTLTVWL